MNNMVGRLPQDVEAGPVGERYEGDKWGNYVWKDGAWKRPD